MPVPADLLTFARQLRHHQTDAETLLWSLLRDRRFCGFKFRRQYPLGGYILDFYCHTAKLAIELDGGGHSAEDRKDYDQARTSALAGAGVQVVRFWNNDVFNSLESVLDEIHALLIKGNP